MRDPSPKEAKIEYLRRLINRMAGDEYMEDFRNRCLWEWTRLTCSKW